MPMRRYWLILLLLPLAMTATAADAELNLKAVYLGRFASYVTWPPAQQTHFTITVIGNNPFGQTLDALYLNKLINGRPVRLRYVDRLEQLSSSDLLYINVPTHTARQAIIDHARKHHILTISDSRGFADQGGIIQINFVGQSARIQINHDAASQSGLRIAAPLLSIATVLRSGPP